MNTQWPCILALKSESKTKRKFQFFRLWHNKKDYATTTQEI